MKLRKIVLYLIITAILIIGSMYSFFNKKTTVNIELTSFETSKPVLLKNLCKKSGGKPLFINFWATWCPICCNDIDAISTLARKHVNIVFISTDQNISTAQNFIERRGHTNLQMYSDIKGEAMKFFKVRGLPTTIKVDKHCKIIDTHVGPLSASSIALFFNVRLKDI